MKSVWHGGKGADQRKSSNSPEVDDLKWDAAFGKDKETKQKAMEKLINLGYTEYTEAYNKLQDKEGEDKDGLV